ncbi:MAG: hypothetical protein KIT31_09210 [Deltaproteobacteria bacterium]|nr:hypothetical protein [Deltaproteobacteria bacterium]
MLRLYAALFAIGLVVYGTVAWSRLGEPSEAPHFMLQADAWLHGSAAVSPPLSPDDWAVVETVVLDDDREVRGRRLVTRPAFRTLGGEEIALPRVRRSLGHAAYVSFPPFPTLIMLPSALVFGRGATDVIPTVFIAALVLPLTLLLLRRLAAAGLSRRSLPDDLWLVATLAFGTVMFFSSVQGKVWYTAHVVGVALALVYSWASIEARHPVVAGLALGAAALTRTSMAFMFPLFLFEAWRIAQRDPEGVRRALVRPLLRFAIPVAAFALAGMAYNYARFSSPTEFGHTYLALGNFQPVYQQKYIETWGLAHYHYLSRNLTVAFTLLPDLSTRAPYISISGHGLAMWVTTPLLFLTLWPREKGALHRPLWITTALVAIWPFLYMNSGWFQFGYRFSLDYTVFLIALIAVGGRPLGKVAKALIVAGIIVNLFGAITFYRYHQFYRGGAARETVIAN